MNSNRKIHITVAAIGLFISVLLSITGMFILPPNSTTHEMYILYSVMAYTGVILFVIFAIYLSIAISNKGNSTLKKVGKTCLYAIFGIAALSLIIGGLIAAIDFLPLGAGLIIGGIAFLALLIDFLAESAAVESNKFVVRISVGTGTLIAIAIIVGCLLI